MKLTISIACSALVFGGVCQSFLGHTQRPNLPLELGFVQDQDDDVIVDARRLFMRGKLASNQKIVEGLSVKNFQLIADGAAETRALVKGQHWFVLNTAEYQRFSAEMELAATRLEKVAAEKNVDGAALRYFDLTLTCLDCHGYIEKQKY